MPFAQLLQYLLQNVLPFATSWFKIKQETKAIPDYSAPKQTVPEVKVEAKSHKIVTLEQYLTACGRYPERQHDTAITDQMIADADILIDRVTNLMTELGIKEIDITSGYRPSSVNVTVANAAKFSAHMTCQAVDILDNHTQDLAHKMTVELLTKHSLYMESPTATKGRSTNWVHLQIRITRNRIFQP